MNHPNETWKPVPGFEGRYEVSDLGRVKSLARVVKVKDPRRGKGYRNQIVKELVLKQKWNGRYWQVTLASDGKQTTFNTHRLVAAAFLGPCPDKRQVCHGKFGARDNRLCNLSYGTPSKNNSVDKYRDGTDSRGEKSCRAKLNDSIVKELYVLREAGWTYAALAAAVGVSKATVRFALTGHTWKHLALEHTSA